MKTLKTKKEMIKLAYTSLRCTGASHQKTAFFGKFTLTPPLVFIVLRQFHSKKSFKSSRLT